MLSAGLEAARKAACVLSRALSGSVPSSRASAGVGPHQQVSSG